MVFSFTVSNLKKERRTTDACYCTLYQQKDHNVRRATWRKFNCVYFKPKKMVRARLHQPQGYCSRMKTPISRNPSKSKKDRDGITRHSSFWPLLASLLVWGMSGGFRGFVRKTVEVLSQKFNLYSILLCVRRVLVNFDLLFLIPLPHNSVWHTNLPSYLRKRIVSVSRIDPNSCLFIYWPLSLPINHENTAKLIPVRLLKHWTYTHSWHAI